jgi:hypothetical protein
VVGGEDSLTLAAGAIAAGGGTLAIEPATAPPPKVGRLPNIALALCHYHASGRLKLELAQKWSQQRFACGLALGPARHLACNMGKGLDDL